MKSKFRALGEKIWVKPIFPDKKTESGIYLTPFPDTNKNEWAFSGEVVAIGSKCDDIALNGLKEGDIVYWEEGFHAKMAEIEGEEYLYLFIRNILYYERT